MSIPMKVTAARAKFESIRQALESFRHEHQALIEEHDQLIIEYNDACKHYKAAVHDTHDQLGSKYGDWQISIPTMVDADLLVDKLGEDTCVERGLVEKKYAIRRQTYDTQVRNGQIPAHISDEVEGLGSVRLTGPKPVGIYKR